MEIKSIGIIKTEVKEGIDNNWGNIISEIHINPEYAQGIKGLDQFSHIIVIFYMDKSSFDIRTDLIRRPQGRSDMPEIGIFAQRAKHRPNPIGITSVKLIDITDNIIKVKGLDAIDNSPVLDIKPYFNHFDKINDNSMPDWINILMKDYF